MSKQQLQVCLFENIRSHAHAFVYKRACMRVCKHSLSTRVDMCKARFILRRKTMSRAANSRPTSSQRGEDAALCELTRSLFSTRSTVVRRSIKLASIMFIPPTFRRSNHIIPSVMSRLPRAFHSEMRHYAEVKRTLNFRFTAPLTEVFMCIHDVMDTGLTSFLNYNSHNVFVHCSSLWIGGGAVLLNL